MNGTLNKVTLIGHLGDDLKIHYFEKGNCIARCPLATHEVHINKTTNEKITNTEWHQIVFRNKMAEFCEKRLSKGDKIYVEGKIKSRQWQSSDGQMRHTTEIIVSEFMFINVKEKETAPKNRAGEAGDDYEVPKISEEEDEDYPF